MTPLLADVGIPMIVLQLPAMVVLLIPVVLLEAFVVNRYLRIGFAKCASGVFRANLASTLLGFPLAWALMLCVEFASGFLLEGAHRIFPAVERIAGSPIFEVASLPLFAAWVPGEELWTIPIAAAVLLIPSFYISVWIERKICARIWSSEPPTVLSSARKAVWQANVVLYLFLFGVAVCYEVYVFATKGWPKW